MTDGETVKVARMRSRLYCAGTDLKIVSARKDNARTTTKTCSARNRNPLAIPAETTVKASNSPKIQVVGYVLATAALVNLL